jgi:hypothetical protein
MRRGANSVTNADPNRQHAADADAGGSKNDPKPGKKTGTADAPCFPKSHLPVFSLLFAFGEII